jgi:Tol biopolymer transport system component/DNA-binding winged helix-turn-helix (wHTH) protein
MDGESSSDAASTARVIRFTPFELDVRAAELRKYGVRLRLPGQSFRVLLLLLEHPGAVVLREEIRGKLWPNGTIVEFDHSINTAIKQIRGVLGDSAENPGYVETVGRQGYRFIGQLDAQAGPQPEAPAGDPDGEAVSHFRILRTLGEGAMGKVCLAEDLKLGRQVALKFLADDSGATSPALLERFRREARAAAALSHPNICTVYGVEEHEGRPVIVMEFVEGETLAARLERGALKLDQALVLGMQIAGALAEAHRKGVVHRDLKPANIMIGKSSAKVLDFGLAKIERRGSDEEQAHTMTAEGTLLGTVQYMSPEQAQGKEADARSDIFSFGLVLYEMIAGKRAFEGSNAASIIAAILEREAPALEPEGLNRVVRACLAKDPADRFQTARDLQRALEWSVPGDGTAAPPVKRDRRRLIAAVFAPAFLAAAGWLLFRYTQPKSPPPSLVQLTSYEGYALYPSFSPDGNQVAFAWDGEKGDKSDIYVKLVGASNPVRLTTDPAPERWPAWSPDGKRIAFQRNRPGAPGIWLVSPLGGAEEKLADVRAMGQMSWSPDGKWLAAALAPAKSNADNVGDLFLVPVDGGEPRRLSSPKAPAFDIDASFSPNGRLLAYSSCASVWSCDLFLQQLDSSYLPVGDLRRITRQGVHIKGLAWSRDGASLIYSGSLSWGMTPRLWRVGISGRQPPERLDLAGVMAWYPTAAPAGDRLAFSRSTTNFDVWRYQIGGTPEPFLKSSADDFNAQFSPDGSRIAFGSSRSGEVFEIWVVNADGSRPFQLTKEVGRGQGTPRWSPDGRLIAFDSLGQDGRSQIYVIDANGGRPRRVSSATSSDFEPSWSRDCRWIYFFSDRTGRNEVWRVPLDGGAAQQMTGNGGSVAFESTDGRTLFYTKFDTKNWAIFARPLDGGPERQVLDDIVLGAFAVFEDGIYHIGRPGPDKQYPIQFYKFSTGTSSLLIKVAGPLQGGLSVSPDRKTILFGKSASAGADLMMIENFR